jgi:hypothetical protein
MKVYTVMEQAISTILLITEDFPANMIHNKRDERKYCMVQGSIIFYAELLRRHLKG